MSSVGDCDVSQLANVDYLLMGCWTNGLFVVLQHPDEPWLAFVRDLPSIARARVGLFTTYQLLTGSMFAKMREALAGKTPAVSLELKSRDGRCRSATGRRWTSSSPEGRAHPRRGMRNHRQRLAVPPP